MSQTTTNAPVRPEPSSPPFVQPNEFNSGCNHGIIHEQDNVNRYVVPNNGYYAIYLGARGANTKDAIFREPGTNLYLSYLKRGDVISFNLGENAIALIKGKQISATSREIPNNLRNGNQSSIIISFLGTNWSQATTRSYFNGMGHGPWGIENNLRISFRNYDMLIPNPNDVRWNSTGNWKAWQWFTIEIDFPEDGVYGFGGFGDDVGNIALDGEPIVWWAKNDPNRFIGNKANNVRNGENGGWTKKFITKGKHRIWIYNISNYCCAVWTTYIITKPDGSVLASPSTHIPSYIGQPVDCMNKIIIPKFEQIR